MTDEAQEFPQLPSWEDIQRLERSLDALALGKMAIDWLQRQEGRGLEKEAAVIGISPARLKGRRDVYNRVEALLDYTGTLGIEDAEFYQRWRKAIERILLLIKPLCFQEDD